MSKHTPGPWILSLDAPYPIVQRGRTGGIQVMAPNPSIALADARLISAAPELLEFAQDWLSRQGGDDNYMTAKARAAIAKATGAQQ